MSYDTKYNGILLFNKELTTKQLCFLSTFLRKNTENHPEWSKYKGYGELMTKHGGSIDLEISSDFLGLQWNGRGSNYNMVEAITFLINAMKTVVDDFTLTGQFDCRGEELDDIWTLIIENDEAKRMDVYKTISIKDVKNGKAICPHCKSIFKLEE